MVRERALARHNKVHTTPEARNTRNIIKPQPVAFLLKLEEQSSPLALKSAYQFSESNCCLVRVAPTDKLSSHTHTHTLTARQIRIIYGGPLCARLQNGMTQETFFRTIFVSTGLELEQLNCKIRRSVLMHGAQRKRGKEPNRKCVLCWKLYGSDEKPSRIKLSTDKIQWFSTWNPFRAC